MLQTSNYPNVTEQEMGNSAELAEEQKTREKNDR